MFIFSKETNKFEYNQIFQTTFLKIFKNKYQKAQIHY